MRRTIATLALLLIALPASAFSPCHTVHIVDGQVVDGRGDSETLTWTVDGTVLTWNVGAPVQLDEWVESVTACEDGTIFLSSPPAEGGEGPEYSETVPATPADTTTTTTTVPDPEVADVVVVAVVFEPVVVHGDPILRR